MFDTSVVFASLNHSSAASEMHEKAYRTATDCIPCRGLPDTWSDPIVEVPRRTRGVAIQPWGETLYSTQRDDANHVDQRPHTLQEPIGTRPTGEIAPFHDVQSGYLPWATIQAVSEGVLTLQAALPADASHLKVEAWLEVADMFVEMGDFETAATCIGNVLKMREARSDVEEALFLPAPAVLPPLMPSTSTNSEASTDDLEDLQPEETVNHDDDWAIIDLSADGSSSPPIDVGAQGVPPTIASKGARLIPRALGLHALASRLRALVL